MNKMLASVTNLFFPELCSGCGCDLSGRDQLLCLRCLDNLPVTNFHLHANNPVEKIFWGRLPLTTASSYLYFTKDSLLQNLLHQFKYNGKKEIGTYFGRRMGQLFMQSNRYNQIDALIPLPLFSRKERARGYNQATELCNGIAEIMQIPVLLHAIERRKATQTQTHKNRIQRWENIEGKFELCENNSILNNKHVLLVDDVITTGATLESCGIELLKSGSLKLSIATLAFTSL